MSRVLEQAEIDALLQSLAAGDLPEMADEPQIFSRARRDLERVEIRDYDFKRPERISKDQMRALQTLHESFARNFGAFLSGYLRTIVEVRVAAAEQMTYGEFLAGLPNPTSFNLFEADALDGQACLELSPLIVYPIIDRLLGGSSGELFIPQRPMTIIETRLVKRVLERCASALTEAWESIRPIDFRLGAMESNPHLVQIVPPNEVVVVIGFETRLANRAGTMSLCLPFTVIEPFVRDLSTRNWFLNQRRRGDEGSEQAIAAGLSAARVEVAAVLAETQMTVTEFRDLEVGDVITTGRGSDQPVILKAEGIPKFLGQIGQLKGSRAIRVERAVEPGERLS